MIKLSSLQTYGQIFSLSAIASISLIPPTLAADNTCNLPQAIAAITNQTEQQKATWGIAIQDVQTNEVIYQENAHKYFIPASNIKLLTTAAALQSLGKDYQFKTEIYTIGQAPHLEQLIIRGSGDPTLTTAQLTNALNLLESQGIQTIQEVILDDTALPNLTVNPTWEWSDLPFNYAPSVNSLTLDQNTVFLSLVPSQKGELTTVQWSEAIAAQQWQLNNQLITADQGAVYTGNLTQKYGTRELLITGEIAQAAEADIWSLSIPDPDQYALDQITQILNNQQIAINKTTISQTTSPDLDQANLLTAIASPPLSEILQITNQDSNNLFAESLYYTVLNQGYTVPQLLQYLGVDSEGYQLKDGSGLSRHNLATPFTFVQTLDVMADHPDADIYKNSLAIAAETGTLRNRFKETPIAGHFFGKTGTMTHIQSLSGYLELPNGNTLALSILVNQSPQPVRRTRASIDAIVSAVYAWSQCPTPTP